MSLAYEFLKINMCPKNLSNLGIQLSGWMIN